MGILIKKYLVEIFHLLILCLFANIISGQVGGISGSKVNSVNHVPIPVGTAEFEPSYTFSKYTKAWNDQGNLGDAFSSIDSAEINASWNMRMAYAFTDELEVGCNLGSNYSNWSAKYAIGNWDKLGLGLMTGLNLPFGNALIDKSNRASEHIGNYGLGIIGSYQFSEKASFDLNIQNFKNLFDHVEISNNDFYISADFGHYVGRSFLLASMYFQKSDFDGFTANVLRFSPGISIEHMSNYFIVLNGNFDLLGKNMPKTNGFSIAFTITL